MLTCIYEASASKRGHTNIKLVLEPIEQYSLLDQYIHVDADLKKAECVMKSIREKISPQVYRELAYASMAYEEEILRRNPFDFKLSDVVKNDCKK